MVSAAAAPQRRAVVFKTLPSSASEPLQAQLLRHELRLDDSGEDASLCIV